MKFPTALSTAAILMALSFGVAIAPMPAPAQTPPPTPTTEATTDDDDLPPPVSRRTGNDDNDGPPPVTPGDDIRTTGDDDDTPPPIRQLAYYAAINGQQVGPLDEEGLIGLIRDGTLTVDTRVWTKGMADWDVASNIPEMAALIEKHAVTTPPEAPPEVTYFIIENGAQAGPFTLAQLREKVTAGAFLASTKVWTRGMPDWQSAGEVAELAALIKDAPAPEAKDASSFLEGRWELGPINVPVEGAGPGTLRIIMEIAPGGTFRTQTIVDFSQLSIQMRNVTDSEGTYKASYKSADMISVVAKGSSIMTQINRQTGASQQVNPQKIDASFDFKVIDQNTMDDGSAQKWRRTSR